VQKVEIEGFGHGWTTSMPLTLVFAVFWPIPPLCRPRRPGNQSTMSRSFAEYCFQFS